MTVTVTMPPISVPVIQGGMMAPVWYRFFETLLNRTGGANDAIATNSTELSLKANKDITITLGNGLTGGGDLSNNIEIDALQDTGWTAVTGAGDKGAYTQYAGQTVSVAYVQAEAQATDNAAKGLSARVVALEAAIRNNGGIDG